MTALGRRGGAVRGLSGVRLVPVGGEAPEDVLGDSDGGVYAGLADGRIVRVAGAGSPAETVARTPGRPLGLEFLAAGELVVCASDAGLLAVSVADGRVRPLVDRVEGRPLGACNNAAVAADGTVYFSDSSTRFAVPQWRADLVQRTRTGRLFRRDADGRVTTLLVGLDFANGVALSADGSFVAVAETGARRVQRFWLTGPRAGTRDVLVDDLPGYPDNISRGSDGLIWIALPGPRTALLGAVQRLPSPARSLVRRIPERFQPAPSPTVAVMAVDDAGRVVHHLSGEVPGFSLLTGVREVGGTLWFGSLTGQHVATVPRPPDQPAGAVP
jgi:sugar lactone lactonase YvrE